MPVPLASDFSSSLEPLREGWIRSAWRLSTQAGWNQTEEDWRRLLRLPTSMVRVLPWEGEVRAASSVVSHGQEISWIGMVLVDQAFRGRGWGKLVLADALSQSRSTRVVGLDATVLGQPIYEKNGFEVLVPTIRWAGKSPANLPSPGGVDEGWNAAILDLDAECARCDRSALLRDLANSDGRFACLKIEDRLQAYGVIRPGRLAWHLGPIVARDGRGFQKILESLLALCAGDEVICDVLNPLAGPVLEKHGLRSVRELMRMTSPLQKDCLCGPGIWCGAGFEWG